MQRIGIARYMLGSGVCLLQGHNAVFYQYSWTYHHAINSKLRWTLRYHITRLDQCLQRCGNVGGTPNFFSSVLCKFHSMSGSSGQWWGVQLPNPPRPRHCSLSQSLSLCKISQICTTFPVILLRKTETIQCKELRYWKQDSYTDGIHVSQPTIHRLYNANWEKYRQQNHTHIQQLTKE